ncbi:type IV secretory system conjugative DNA transfer family protein [Bythopirellula polymerisocia]|uniref:Type IV secretion-system coupling protein DNA-binding domain protein n=1 Tax=Bythopirellula polymerisocia TaxID=2528003 RepID=A0A5C6CY45_9BACT|nr:type IV secretion system DNA-binding domain-containing protein [Bythopirellula polymerisocia]TWU29853.1 Type IV secretion-system coupling protein DNA-binding domain protein [Bythopirellula polymerisocia]
MTLFSNEPNCEQAISNDELFFDPTDPNVMRSQSQSEVPPKDYCRYYSGTRHPTPADISAYTSPAEPGAILLPATIPLLNTQPSDPLSREPIYGVDLVLQTQERATHTMVLGVTGAGKNTQVIDPLRYSAISDPHQSVITFSLKSSDYGPIAELCRQTNKRLVVVNLNNSWRSVGWNPLATKDKNEAFARISRFADSVKNSLSRDSEFWTQWIKTALKGAWDAGYRSFPAMFNLFSLSFHELLIELRGHRNPSSRQLANFLTGSSGNAETVLASIIGALTSFLSESAMRVMSRDDLKLDRLFKEPVCLHIEMPETSLETQRVLYQMLALSVTDELINTAERSANRKVEATIFYDDMPSLGYLLSPERLMTMRSRGIGIVAGVQTISSLELAYGPSCRALMDNFSNKIVLPGGPASDADCFSHASGEQMVSLPCYEGENSSFCSRPLLSSASIRSPNYTHPLFGLPATLMFGSLSFQAYLQKSYELRPIAALLRATRAITGHERLRSRQLPMPKFKQVKQAANSGGTEEKGFMDVSNWSEDRIRVMLEEVRKTIGWDNTTGSARKWWKAFEEDNAKKLQLVLRLAEELKARKATITEFFLSYVYSNTDNIQANLHYLDYTRVKKEDQETKKRKRAENATGDVPPPAESGSALF